jgi:hypothetical protein
MLGVSPDLTIYDACVALAVYGRLPRYSYWLQVGYLEPVRDRKEEKPPGSIHKRAINQTKPGVSTQSTETTAGLCVFAFVSVWTAKRVQNCIDLPYVSLYCFLLIVKSGDTPSI